MKIGKIWKNRFFVKKNEIFWNFNFFLLIISWHPCDHEGVCISVKYNFVWYFINFDDFWHQNANYRTFKLSVMFEIQKDTFKINNNVKNALTQYVFPIWNSEFNYYSICIFKITLSIFTDVQTPSWSHGCQEMINRKFFNFWEKKNWNFKFIFFTKNRFFQILPILKIFTWFKVQNCSS